jgi:hypothetical protein
MLLFLYEDEFGWIYEPHGEEALCYNLAFDGRELLRAAGWRPYEMHRVSRYLHESFLIDGLLEPYVIHNTPADRSQDSQDSQDSQPF